MIIKEIKVFNVKCYERLTLNFSGNINLLVGPNNSGKSTIIRSLLNLQYKAFDKSDIRSLATYSKIITRFDEVSESDNQSFLNRSKPNEFEIASSLTVLYELFEKNENSYYIKSSSIKSIDDSGKATLNKDIKRQELPLRDFGRFPDSENNNNFIYPYLAKRKTEFYDSSINQEQVYKVQENLRNLAARVQKISNLSHPRRGEFEKLCNEILGFPIGVIPSNQNNNNGVEPGIYVANNYMIPIKSMGEGVANILGFIVTLLTEDKKLYLIEELENDIHPNALKKLLELIIEKSKNNQFVISTHSHIVLKYLGTVRNCKIFDVACTHYIDRPEGRVNIPTSSVKEVNNIPEERMALLEKLGYEFHDYELYMAYLILEESSAESIINNLLIPNFVPELAGKLKTISAGGVDNLNRRASDFWSLFVYLHNNPVYKNRAWVVADGDKQGIDVINKLKEASKSWPKEHFINLTQENFERYFPTQFQSKVEKVLQLKNKQKKEAKEKLLLEVMEWTSNRREEAIIAFKDSAEEVISILKTISKSIKKS